MIQYLHATNFARPLVTDAEPLFTAQLAPLQKRLFAASKDPMDQLDLQLSRDLTKLTL